jgi:hypothetical protein
MVEVGVAVKIYQEIMYDETGAITSDRSKMVGRPTMYVLTNQERVVFVVIQILNHKDILVVKNMCAAFIK